MKPLFFLSMLFTSTMVLADTDAPPPQHLPVADCEFKRIRKNERVFCKAAASICFGANAAGADCKNKLKIWCNGEKIFSGEWVPKYKENPELYILKGSGEGSAPVIEIMPNSNDKHDNPAVLFLDDLKLRGRCELFLDFRELR